MFIHTIVYVILSAMMATAAFASSMPINKAPREQQAEEVEKEATRTPQE